MKKNYIARRRGTSVAAAALSFALVAPLAQPVALADEPPAVVADENWYAPKPADAASNVEAYADAIYSPGEADQKGTITGSVKEIVEAGVGFGNVQDSGKAMKGVKVFAQWYEGVNTEHASPVYYTETDENGNFTLNMAPYTDAAGVERQFQADASVGLSSTGRPSQSRDQLREKIRIWAELPEEMASEYRLVHQPAVGISPDADITPNSQGDMRWTGNRVQGVTIQYSQKTALPQHLPEDQWVESQGTGGYGVYRGQAFWNLRVAQGALNHSTSSKYDGNDVPAAGLQVIGSYLSDEAVAAIHEHVAKNYAGKTLRGGDWTVDDEQGLQRWINEQIAKDPEAWIAETVKTTTAADGSFKLFWRGLYGQAWDRKGTVPEDKFHTLAPSRDEGTFINGNHTSKHVNMEWSLVQVLGKDGKELPDNVGMIHPWVLGHWDGPNAGTYSQVFGGDGAEINKLDDIYLRWNIALYPAPLKFDVLEKNTYDNWARVGETIETYADSLPVGEALEYVIEWTNDAGEVVQSCGPVTADAGTRVDSCPLTVPADAEHGDVFTARLYQGKDNKGTLLAQDAFAVTTSYLAYEPQDAKVGTPEVSKPAFDDPNTEAVEPKLESAEFFLNEDKLPEGVTADQVKVDPKTGVVTFTPKAGQEGKSFDIPVKMVDTAIQVPVFDENGDPVLDGDGNQVTRPRTIARSTAAFTAVEEPEATKYLPNYGDRKNIEAGKTETSQPFEGMPNVPVIETSGKPSAGSEDWTFETAKDSGVVEATAPGYDKVAEKIDSEFPDIDGNWDAFVKILTPYVRPSVDVDFTYNDGSANDATAKFDLIGKDGKSLLDPEGDFDGDGISNKDETEKGTNPADEGSNPDTTAPLINPVKPGDRKITGKGDRPGEDISVTIPGVKDPIRTTTDKDGNWSVDVPTDIDLNSEDRIRVSDEAGNTTETAVGPAALEPLLTDQFDPVYPRAYVRVGESATSVTPNLTRYVNGREFRRQPLRTAGNVAFKVDAPGMLKDNGRVEVTAPKDAQPGDLITVPVQVTYADDTTDTTEAIFEVIPGAYAEMYDPKYEVGRSASPGEQTQVKQVGDNDLPEGTTFTLDRNKSDLNGWGIQVDEATGLITATAPQSREHRAGVVVTVSYADGSQHSITAFVDPQAATSMAETIPVKDALVTVPVGVALDANVVPALPDGTTFDIGAFSDENWSVDVNKDTGEVMVVTTDKVQPNDRVVVPVVVKFPDGSETTVNVTVVATKPQTTQHQPVYVASKVAPGERTSLRLEVQLDKKVGATYSLAGNAAGLKAEIDPETGVITVQADAGAKPGTRVLPVDVRYADGSVERIQARVEVTGTGVTANPACDDGSSNSSTSSTSSTSSESCTTGSSTGGVIAIILGVLAVIGGAAWAAFINQDAVRDVLRNFGIKF